MKTFKSLIYLFAGITLFLTSCSEEIEPSTDGKETAIVYAVLNAQDSVHFVKINRALYAGGDMSQSALIADSSYFDQVDAKITETVSGTVTRVWTLKDTLVENKEAGAFYYPTQKLYYFSTIGQAPLKTEANVVYKFEAVINGGEFTITSETSMVGGMAISMPSDASSFSFASNNIEQYGYASSNINYNTGNSEKVEVFLDVEFEEYAGASLLNTKTFRWKITEVDQEDLNPTMSTSAGGQTFYELIAQNVTKDDPSITRRKLKGIDVVIDGASGELQKYILVNKPSSSLAQNKPLYTNLSISDGMRVIGIFTSRYSTHRYKDAWRYAGGSSYYAALNPNSMKELCNGAITGSYLFCSDNPADGGLTPQPYFCD